MARERSSVALVTSRIASVAGRAIWSSDAVTGKQWSLSRRRMRGSPWHRLKYGRGFSIELRGRLNGGQKASIGKATKVIEYAGGGQESPSHCKR